MGPLDDSLFQAVRHFKEGQASEDSVQRLLQRFRPRLISYFRRHNFSHADAEDLVQETFRRVLTSIGGLKEETRFMAWLFQIARNVRLTARVSMAYQQQTSGGEAEIDQTDLADPNPDPLSAAIQHEELLRAREAVERLPARQKQCLLLRVVHEMSYNEIATVLRLSVSTVRNHLHEARCNLRRVVSDANPKGSTDGQA